MGVGQKEFLTAVVIDTTICIVVFVLFTVLRRIKAFNKYYAPKRYIRSDRKKPKRLPGGLISWIRPIFTYTQEEMLAIAGMDAVMYLRIFSFGIRLFLVIGLFNLATVLPTNLTSNNVDSLLKEQEKTNTTTELSPEAGVSEITKDDFEVTDFDKMSISNIKGGESKLWVHVVSGWFTTLYTIWLLKKFHKEAVQLRIQYLATTKRGAESHSVLVTDIPGLTYGTILSRACDFAPKFARPHLEKAVSVSLSVAERGLKGVGNLAGEVTNRAGFSGKSGVEELASVTDLDPWNRANSKLRSGLDMQEFVLEEFTEVYPEGEVASAVVVYDQTELEPLVSSYETVQRNLEDLVDDYTSKIRRRKKVNPTQIRVIPVQYGSWGIEMYGGKPVKIDKLRFLIDRLTELKRRIETKQEICLQKTVPTAFITFNSRHSQVVSSTSLHHHDESCWKIQPAPGPDEIVWANLKWRSWERTLRAGLIWAAFVFLIFTFMIPVLLLQALIQIEQLDQTPVIKDIVKVTIIRGVLTAIIPGLALKIFLAILPALLEFMNKLQGMVSYSKIDFGVCTKFFIFQVATVFFGSFIGGTLFSQIKELKDDPDKIIDILGTSAPQTATFFTTYILINALITTPIGILRITGVIIYWLLSKVAATDRAKARLWQNQTMSYGPVIPDHTLVILLGIVFAAVNPIITVVALVYFLVNTLVWRYQMLYVYKECYQSGGRVWVQVFDQVVAGLLIMQLLMIGLLGVKKFPYAPVVLPMPFLTVGFYIYMKKLFDRPLTSLSLRGAADLDRRDKDEAAQAAPLSDAEKSEIDRLYLSPCFKLDGGEHEALLAEAENVRMRLNGENVPIDVEANLNEDHDEYYSADDEALI